MSVAFDSANVHWTWLHHHCLNVSRWKQSKLSFRRGFSIYTYDAIKIIHVVQHKQTHLGWPMTLGGENKPPYNKFGIIMCYKTLSLNVCARSLTTIMPFSGMLKACGNMGELVDILESN